jgi:hypothetical protein
MNKKNFGYLLLIIGLVAINELLFRWIGHISYIEWFIKNGSQIGIVGALVTLVWDINKHTGLISASPSQYVGSYFQLLGMTYISLGRQMVSKNRQGDEKISFFDTLIVIIINFILAVMYFIWMFVIAPFQYFVILILGVPARVFLKSDAKIIAKFDDTKLNYEELPKEKGMPKGWMDVSYSNKPVTFTNALITLTFAIVKIFWTG